MNQQADTSAKKEIVKKIIKSLHAGTAPEDIKAEYTSVLQSLQPQEISRIEEELIEEGMSPQEICALCDVHLALFRKSLEQKTPVRDLPPGHPISILVQEHDQLLHQAQSLVTLSRSLQDQEKGNDTEEKIQSVEKIIKHLKSSENHYVREENVLFPYCEAHGVVQPPAIMWSEHDQIRGIKKHLFDIWEKKASVTWPDSLQHLEEKATALAEILESHFYKETNILFPTALTLFSEHEWRDIRAQFDELGYCCITPPPSEYESPAGPVQSEDADIVLETGTFSTDQLESMLNTLSVDITFVDASDSVTYFNMSEDRIFPRTKAVIGRKVQNCHPQKSVHKVNQILDEFREGKRDSAAFWINLQDRLIYIRYFAVRNSEDTYMGCLEVSQDITDIKKITGEKRLLG